jgi:hypothetical protein
MNNSGTGGPNRRDGRSLLRERLAPLPASWSLDATEAAVTLSGFGTTGSPLVRF